MNFAHFTWENAHDLICDGKQRNRENFNFKSVASAISPHRRAGESYSPAGADQTVFDLRPTAAAVAKLF